MSGYIVAGILVVNGIVRLKALRFKPKQENIQPEFRENIKNNSIMSIANLTTPNKPTLEPATNIGVSVIPPNVVISMPPVKTEKMLLNKSTKPVLSFPKQAMAVFPRNKPTDHQNLNKVITNYEYVDFFPLFSHPKRPKLIDQDIAHGSQRKRRRETYYERRPLSMEFFTEEFTVPWIPYPLVRTVPIWNNSLFTSMNNVNLSTDAVKYATRSTYLNVYQCKTHEYNQRHELCIFDNEEKKVNEEDDMDSEYETYSKMLNYLDSIPIVKELTESEGEEFKDWGHIKNFANLFDFPDEESFGEDESSLSDGSQQDEIFSDSDDDTGFAEKHRIREKEKEEERELKEAMRITKEIDRNERYYNEEYSFKTYNRSESSEYDNMSSEDDEYDNESKSSSADLETYTKDKIVGLDMVYRVKEYDSDSEGYVDDFEENIYNHTGVLDMICKDLQNDSDSDIMYDYVD